MHELFAAQTRALDALLGRRAALARRRHRLERLAGGAVGVGERGLGERERVGGLPARGFGLVEFVRERAGAAGEFVRRVGDSLPLPLRLGAAVGEFGDAGTRVGLAARSTTRARRRSPRGARRGRGPRARAFAPRRAPPDQRRPLPRRHGARAFKAQRDIVARPEPFERGLGVRLALGGLVQRRAGARERLLDRRQARQRLRALALEFRERVARGVRSRARRARALPRSPFRRRSLPRRFGRDCGLGGERRDRLARGFGFALEVAEAVLFGEAARGGSWRIGRGDEAVPAPEVAFDRNQPLAGFEHEAQPLALGAGDDADLRQAAGERGRRGNARGERVRARRQLRVVAGWSDQRPMRRRRNIDRGVEIVAQRRAQRRLIAAGDADRIDRARPGAARSRAEEAGKRQRLGLQPLRGALGFRERPARARLDCARRRVTLLRRQRFALGGGERLGQLGDGFSARCALRLLEARPRERGALALDSLAFGLQSGEPAPLLLDRAKERAAPGVEVGRRGLGLGERAFGAGETPLGARLLFARVRRVLLRLPPARRARHPRPRASP